MDNVEKDRITKWIDSLKIAILQKDCEVAFGLTQDIPFEKDYLDTYDKEKEELLDIARELILQSIKMLEDEKTQTMLQLEKIKKAKKFLSLD